MSKLFIEIYLDENVHVLIAKIVQSHGFKALTTQDAGRKGASEERMQLVFSAMALTVNLCRF